MTATANEVDAVLRQVIQDAEANDGTLDWLTITKVRELQAKLQPEALTPQTTTPLLEAQDD